MNNKGQSPIAAVRRFSFLLGCDTETDSFDERSLIAPSPGEISAKSARSAVAVDERMCGRDQHWTAYFRCKIRNVDDEPREHGPMIANDTADRIEAAVPTIRW